jgi:hypothetical protein
MTKGVWWCIVNKKKGPNFPDPFSWKVITPGNARFQRLVFADFTKSRPAFVNVEQAVSPLDDTVQAKPRPADLDLRGPKSV